MIVDLGTPTTGNIEQAAAHALGTLANLREGRFSGTVAVSFLYDDERVACWPDDTVETVVARWHEERARNARQSTPTGYVGKRRAGTGG